ncbi:MAG: hypothetical protein JW991_02745 [Candidatus Pacebacteria bacterium]|nr:hypothetical protein [Candidatus Paceibacterota bacterium]
MDKPKNKKVSLEAVILITIGVIFLLERRLPGFDLGPLLLIGIGVGMLFKHIGG